MSIVREGHVGLFSLNDLLLQELKEKVSVGVLPSAQNALLQLTVRQVLFRPVAGCLSK